MLGAQALQTFYQQLNDVVFDIQMKGGPGGIEIGGWTLMIVPRISVTPAAFQKRSIIGQYLGPGTYVGGKDPMRHLLFRDLCGLSTKKN